MKLSATSHLMTGTRKLFALGLAVVLCACTTPSGPFQPSLWVEGSPEHARLAVLEFSERGNLFDRARLQELVDYAKSQEDTLAIVFVHGWKHNAQSDDSNLKSFQKMLAEFAALPQPAGVKHVLGIYLGWPGRSVSIPGLEELTFWSRQRVAAEVARGGVTDVLLQLEHALVPDEANTKDNVLIVVGHSFGGAIVLGALNDVFLDRLVYANAAEGCIRSGHDDLCGDDPCVLSRRFGHGVVLLNPAIEANDILQLKEIVAARCFPRNQGKLLHVISTSADTATHRYFPVGQALSSWWLSSNSLQRTYRGEPFTLSERDLTTTTVGNFEPFWTGRLYRDGDFYRYCSFALNNFRRCSDKAPPENLIPTRTFEPLTFEYTDGAFMSDHNDVFNRHVAAYLLTIAMEARERRRPLAPQCLPREFHCGLNGQEVCMAFGGCFERLQREFSAEDAGR